MITHFLGKDEVTAYSRDLAMRLLKLDDFPKLWFVLGTSGYKMAKSVLAELPPSVVAQIDIGVVQYDRDQDAIDFLENADLKISQTVFVIDSAVHSGRSMMRLVSALREVGAEKIITYGLILKSGSIIVPNYFGVVIDEKDRTYFELDEIPNNRLHDGKPPIGTLRQLGDADVDKSIGEVGAPFEQLTVGDLIYEKDTNSSKVYCCEEGDRILGFVSFRQLRSNVFIDAWATVKEHQGKGVGSAMLRWTETWARSNKCLGIELWAFESAIEVYTRFGYQFSDDKVRNLGDGQTYRVMRKQLMYNVSIKENEEVFR